MTRWAMGVEYDGTHFCGWQQQSGLRTLEAAFATAISQVADHAISLTCGGRTDSGVRAAGQVLHFDSDARRSARAWVLGTNANLDRKASVSWARLVPDFFHARFSALRRHYRYSILNRSARSALHEGRSLWVQAPLDAQLMHDGGQYLLGEHDFSAFRAAGCQSKSPVRRLDLLAVHREHDLVHIDVAANAFLHHMVRNIAGLLIEVGRGLRPPEAVRALLEGRDRRLNAPTADPEGLCLRRIEYPAAFHLPDPV
ncbi:MAG: tRNA pseudouridine(38-40) synthase TruA [Gammaproteobacteria bacterium]|nr:tRNA pseudouridine(38-40) synthase TruA [Gammaproteobacteria bacterium]